MIDIRLMALLEHLNFTLRKTDELWAILLQITHFRSTAVKPRNVI